MAVNVSTGKIKADSTTAGPAFIRHSRCYTMLIFAIFCSKNKYPATNNMIL